MDAQRLAVSQVTTKNWTFAQDLDEYARLGVKAFALWRDKLDLCGREEGLRLLDTSGLRISSISDSGYFLGKTRSQAVRAVEDVVETVHLAESVGADSVVLITGQGGSVFRSPELDRQIVIDCLRDVAPVAKAAGVKLALEVVNGNRYPGLTFLGSLPDAVSLLEEVGSDSVGVCFDFDHLWEEQDLQEHLTNLQEHLFAVHICDMPTQPRQPFDRRLLGEGAIPLSDLVQAIEKTGYRGYYDLEIFSLDLWEADYTDVIRHCQTAFAAL